MLLTPFEIHVTADVDCIDRFKLTCNNIGVKPIVLDLQKKSGDVLCEVMTSSTFTSEELDEAKKEMVNIIDELKRNNFTVLRGKIETVPWHDLAPSHANQKNHFTGSHFETHFGVLISNETQLKTLQRIARKYALHFSKNVFKKIDDTTYCQMVTHRSYEAVAEDFLIKVEDIKTEILENGLTFNKEPRIEFAIYDTNVEHDLQWLT